MTKVQSSTVRTDCPDTVAIGVGFDTARYGHHVSFLNEGKQFAAEPFHFTQSRAGYERVRKTFQNLQDRYGSVHFHVRVDAAGQYAANLLAFLHDLPVEKTISVGEPARNKAYRQVHFPKRKADPVESLACARFAVIERPEATPQTPAVFAQLRDVAARLQANAKQHTRLVNQLHNELARVFPELAVLYTDLSAAWLLKLLNRFPTPRQIAAASLAELTTVPHVNQAKAEAIQQAARQTTGTLGGDITEELLREQTRDLLACQQAGKRLKELLEKAFDALPAGNHRHVESIKGIGKLTAACLVAKIVSIDRFKTPEELVGYFGTFPEEVQVSGTDRFGRPKISVQMRMSKKGNDLVRRNLYMAACVAIQYNPAVRVLYARQLALGKKPNVALGHCMAKLLHQVWAVWTKGQPFDPDYETQAPRQTTDSATGESAQNKSAQNKWAQNESARNDSSQNESAQHAPSVADPPECKKAVGRNKGLDPDRKAVTTATVKVDALSETVKPRIAAVPIPPPNGRVDFKTVRQEVTIQQLLESLGWWDYLKGRGPQRRGPCPCRSHGEQEAKSRIFSVNLDKQVFRCFDPACGAQGNVLDLWAAVRELSLREAALDLANTFLTDANRGPQEPNAPKRR